MKETFVFTQTQIQICIYRNTNTNKIKKYFSYEFRSESAMKAIIESQKAELKEVTLLRNCFLTDPRLLFNTNRCIFTNTNKNVQKYKYKNKGNSSPDIFLDLFGSFLELENVFQTSQELKISSLPNNSLWSL